MTMSPSRDSLCPIPAVLTPPGESGAKSEQEAWHHASRTVSSTQPTVEKRRFLAQKRPSAMTFRMGGMSHYFNVEAHCEAGGIMV
jgi:hypothetical protein